MNDPPCTLESAASAERDLLTGLKTSLGSLGPAMLNSRMRIHSVFARSASEGGPADQSSAIRAGLEAANIGIRELSRKIGINRKLLLSMIEGRTDMPKDIFDKIYDAIQAKQPTFFDQAIKEASQGGQ